MVESSHVVGLPGCIVKCYPTLDSEADTSQAAWVAILTEHGAPASDCSIVTLGANAEQETILVGLDTGALFCIQATADACSSIEEVGALSGGLAGAQWSPDGNLLCLVSATGQLLLMNKKWDVVEETWLFEGVEQPIPARQMPIENLPEEVHLTAEDLHISWRGDSKYFATSSRAAAGGPWVIRIWEREGCRLHTVGEHCASLSGHIAWQPNGRHLYAACTRPDGLPSITLYERNGLQHGGFDLHGKGVCSGLSWSPDSQLLAVTICSQASNSKVQIWQRSNWHWYLKREVQGLGPDRVFTAWHEEGLCLTMLTSKGLCSEVTLDMQSSASERGTAAVVDGNRLLVTPLRIAAVPPPLSAVVLEAQAPIVCIGHRHGGSSEAIAVALSDGGLAVAECPEEDDWESAAEGPELDNLPQNAVEDISGTTVPTMPLVRVIVEDKGAEICLMHSRHLVWTDHEQILAVGSTWEETSHDEDEVVIFDFTAAESQPSVRFSGRVACGGSILAAAASAHGRAILQTRSGELLMYDRTAAGRLSKLGSFPEPCPSMHVLPDEPGLLHQALGISGRRRLYLGHQLLAEGCTSAVVRTEGAGGSYLLFITSDSVLHTVPLSQLQEGLPLTADEPVAERTKAGRETGYERHYGDMHAAMRGQGITSTSGRDASMRAVEAGSRLVSAPAGATFCVLQMPRGNLEVVSPRALVLAAIAEAILENNYGDAWRLATVNRVDLNVLVDYAWPRFLEHAGDFVAAVGDDQAVCDLLAALKEGSVTAPGGLYTRALPDPPADQVSEETVLQLAEREGKVAAVIKALREALRGLDAKLYVRPLLTSYSALGDIHGALRLIKEAKEEQLSKESGHRQGIANGGPYPAADGAHVPEANGAELSGFGALGTWRKRVSRAPLTAEEALKHLLLSVDVDTLYRSALEMYELELGFMVIAHSQRDPGEYMLQLQQFAARPEGPLRKHALDMHLGRWRHALSDLLQAGPDHFEQALALASDKGLLRELLSELDRQDSRRVQVLEAYGEQLAERNLAEDSAVAYLAAGAHERSLLQYKLAGQWQMAFCLAGRLQWPEEERMQLAAELVEVLSGMGRLHDAAVVSLQHLRNTDAAVQLFCSAHEWRQAACTAMGSSNRALLDTSVAPAAADAAASMLENATDNRKRIQKYVARLKELRAKKEAMEAALAAREDAGSMAAGEDGWDAASQASGLSAVSGMSVYTAAQSGAAPSASAGASAYAPSTVGGRKPGRQRKQKASKGTRIRQGAPDEDKALAAHVLELVPKDQLLSEAAQLCELLILLGHEADAAILQQAVSDHVAEAQSAAAYINETPGLAKESPGQQGPVSWKWDILRPVVAGPQPVNIQDPGTSVEAGGL
ncbi:g412 [Coccomyxa viridis]|uniref:Elongator complex protein 1 n=1 Tax=Coccomyxa viridis TaxID=1274662 RepID=A0ABP1FFU8_9CHLO